MRTAGLLLGLTMAGCGGTQPPQQPVELAHALDSITLAAEPMARERIRDGVVEAVHQATLSAQTAGRVVELPRDVGDRVNEGDVLVRFTEVEQRATARQSTAQLAAAEASFREAEADFTRVSEVFERKLVARAVLDAALARRDNAQAALDAARAASRSGTQQLEYTVIRAPYAGVVTQRLVQVGEAVRPGQALISLLSLQQLRVESQVPQGDAQLIREHRIADVVLDDGARRIRARQVVVFPDADPHTHTFKVRLELPMQDSGLYPGTIVKVAFAVGNQPRLLVPNSALAHRGAITAVYVLSQSSIALRQIRTGHRFGDDIEAISGLSAGDQIATDPVAAGQRLASTRGSR